MTPCQKLDYVQMALSVAVVVTGLICPATVWAASEASGRSPIVSNSQTEHLVQQVLTEPCHQRRRGAPIRRVGGGSHYVEASFEQWKAL